MRYIILFVLFIGVLPSIYAQTPQGNRLNLVSSTGGKLSKEGNAMFYRPVYEHNQNTLSADSGYIYEDEVKRQFFEAYGNVVITQPSGTVIYADKLHYDAAAQLAILTNNVRMVDGPTVLTTNYLTYNMRSKYGTYSSGGRIISQTDTITSQNAYYFETSQDAYFRNKVVVRTPDVKIYTDTMRYNANDRVTHFFGPTDIKGNDGENLYTEKGKYNTESGIADFSKNNLYTEGSRFLKSDSLYYDKATGVGKAYRNVVFLDTLDKFYAYGGYGEYRQSDESITMTDKPLVISVVKDSTQNNQDTTNLSTPVSEVDPTEISHSDSLQNMQNGITDSIGVDSVINPPKLKETVDSIYLTADTLYSKMIYLKDYEALDLNLSRDGGELDIEAEEQYGDDDADEGLLIEGSDIDSTIIDPPTLVKDSIQNDSTILQKPIRIPPPLKEISNIDLKSSEIDISLKEDSLLRESAVIPVSGTSDSLFNEALEIAKSPSEILKDSTSTNTDTIKTRILKAYYNVRLFKSDLQAVADSAYYGEADSMFRFMGNPMIWAEESQISSDTIYLQVKNEQLDNALLKGNAFMVNTVLDTVKFNQLKGRKITAFFKNNSIEWLFVDGNAENLLFSTDEKTKIITEMFHDRSSRIKIKMENKEIIDYTSVRKVDQKVYPFKMVNQENEILPGFIWKPEDRPKSKEDLLNRKRKKADDPSDAIAEGTKNPSGADEEEKSNNSEEETEQVSNKEKKEVEEQQSLEEIEQSEESGSEEKKDPN